MKYDPDIISMDVDGMTLEQEGAYSRSVRHLWRNGPLPKERLQRICGACFDAVFACMVEVDGSWTLQWLEDARDNAKNRQDQTSKAGKVSAAKRSTNVERVLNVRSTNVLSPSISSSTSSPEKERAKVEMLWPQFAGDKCKAKWAEFIAYRQKEHAKRYKSAETEQRALNLALKYFPTGPAFVAALDHTMAKGWQFPVDPSETKYPDANGVPSAPVILNANGKPQQLKPWVN